MKCEPFLKGVEADRFLFLLEAGLDFKKAITTRNDTTLFKEAQEKYLLELLRVKGDPWMLQQVQTCVSAYGIEFKNSFIRLTEAGESVEEAWNYAERRSNTRAAFWKGEIGVRHPTKTNCSTNIRLVICSTNRQAITEEHYLKLLTKLWKPLKKVNDVEEIPNILECSLISDPGYVRVICGDKFSVNWLTSVLSRKELWPNASVCVMREKKYLESQIFAVRLPHSKTTRLHSIFKDLRKQNPGLETKSWKVLTRQPIQDKNDTIQLNILIPRDGDAAAIERAGFELNFNSEKVFLTIPDDCAKINSRIQFTGKFPTSDELTMEEIFKIVEQQNDFICTDLWSESKRRKCNLNDPRKFFTDLRSAEAIERNGFMINFKSFKVQLTPLKPIMEYRKTELGEALHDASVKNESIETIE